MGAGPGGVFHPEGVGGGVPVSAEKAKAKATFPFSPPSATSEVETAAPLPSAESEALGRRPFISRKITSVLLISFIIIPPIFFFFFLSLFIFSQMREIEGRFAHVPGPAWIFWAENKAASFFPGTVWPGERSGAGEVSYRHGGGLWDGNSPRSPCPPTRFPRRGQAKLPIFLPKQKFASVACTDREV